VAQPRKGSPLPRRENRTPAPAGPPTTGPGQRTDARYNNSPLHERERGTYTSSSYTAPTAPGVLRAQYSNSPSRYDSPSRGAYSSDAGESAGTESSSEAERLGRGDGRGAVASANRLMADARGMS
jgi:hypothetical protein